MGDGGTPSPASAPSRAWCLRTGRRILWGRLSGLFGPIGACARTGLCMMRGGPALQPAPRRIPGAQSRGPRVSPLRSEAVYASADEFGMASSALDGASVKGDMLCIFCCVALVSGLEIIYLDSRCVGRGLPGGGC